MSIRPATHRGSIVALGPAIAVAVLTLLTVMLVCAPPSIAAGWPWPVDGDVLTPFRNGSDPYAAGQHRGIDIAAAVGTPVEAVAGGEVTFAGRLPDSGDCVTVDTGRYLVSYLHLASIAVKRGARTGAGALLGTVGTSGKRSVAQPHLHLSVRLAGNGTYVDPLPLLGERPSARQPAAEAEPGARPQSAQPPVAQQRPRTKRDAQVGHGDSSLRAHEEQRAHQEHGRVDARSHTQVHARRRSHTRARSQGQERSGSQNSRPSSPAVDQVHAPPSGDTVAADPAHSASGGAREGHASRGRVAPPPLRGATRQRLTANSPAVGETRVAPTPTSARTARSGPDEGPPWLTPALAVLGCAALGAMLMRRRVRPRHDDGPRDDDRPVIVRPATTAPGQAPESQPGLRVVNR